MSLFLWILISVYFVATSSVSIKERYQQIQKRINNHQQSTTALNLSVKNETLCIMTRDNICLSTTIYTPTGHIGPFNVVYEKTPYTKESLEDDAVQFYDAGYVFVAQDNRGTGDSGGDYSFFRTSPNDTLDTVEYLLSQTWFSGNIAVYGVSANAISQYVVVQGVAYFERNSNPFIEYNADFQHILFGELYLGMDMTFEGVYQGFAYRQGLVSGWMEENGETAYIKTILDNEQFQSSYWGWIEGPLNNNWNYVNQSLIHYAGFYDIFSSFQIETALALNDSAQIRANGNQILVIEAGGHCGGGAIIWPNKTFGYDAAHNYAMEAYKGLFQNPDTFNIHDYFPWNVAWYQLGPGGIGKEGNYWITTKGIPDIGTQYWYLGDNNMLVYAKMQPDGSKSYVYDPKNPVATHGGNNLILSPCGPQSQTKNEKGRNDILHFTSDPLTDNIAVLGMIEVTLYVSSDAVDTDFTAKLIDIYPNGEPMLIQDSIFRMRWRNHMDNPFDYSPAASMKNGEVYEIIIEVGIMSYIFNIGHSISLSISSSNYPRFSVNYNSGNMVIDEDKGWRNATNVIHFGQKYPSMLVLPIIDIQWLNQRKVQL